MQSEIDATIKEKLEKKGCKQDEIAKAIKEWQDKDVDNIPKEILKIGIKMSFHMG